MCLQGKGKSPPGVYPGDRLFKVNGDSTELMSLEAAWSSVARATRPVMLHFLGPVRDLQMDMLLSGLSVVGDLSENRRTQAATRPPDWQRVAGFLRYKCVVSCLLLVQAFRFLPYLRLAPSTCPRPGNVRVEEEAYAHTSCPSSDPRFSDPPPLRLIGCSRNVRESWSVDSSHGFDPYSTPRSVPASSDFPGAIPTS